MYVVHRTSAPCYAASIHNVLNMKVVEVAIALESIHKNKRLIWYNPKINNRYIYRSDIISVLHQPKPSYTLNEITVYPVKEG